MKQTRCIHCGSTEYAKEGFRKTAARGKIQKYRCKKCKRLFTANDGFRWMHHNPKTIAMSVDMYLSNLSSRKMRNQLARHFGIKASHETILSWVRRYSSQVNQYVEGLNYSVGKRFYADETFIKRQGTHDRFWACVDWDTRLITGTYYSDKANPKEARKFLENAVSKGKPDFIQTDSAPFYYPAFTKAFFHKNNPRGVNRGLCVDHRINNTSKTGKHNVRIETVFMKIKDRVQDFRGFKSIKSAPIIMQGLTIQHNWIEPHNSIGKAPAELAGQTLNGQNRWLELIQQSATC